MLYSRRERTEITVCTIDCGALLPAILHFDAFPQRLIIDYQRNVLRRLMRGSKRVGSRRVGLMCVGSRRVGLVHVGLALLVECVPRRIPVYLESFCFTLSQSRQKH